MRQGSRSPRSGIATAVRGGVIDGVIFHTDRGSTYTAEFFKEVCRKLKIKQSMGRTGSCFDCAVAESTFSTLEHEVLSRNRFKTKEEARRYVARWIEGFCNPVRRHSRAKMMFPVDYEHPAVSVVADGEVTLAVA